MGKIIAVIFFIGGAMVIRGLLTPQPHMFFLGIGSFLLVVALFMFFRELLNI